MEKIFALIKQMEADGVIGQGALDAGKFEAILGRHGLLEKWRKFQQDYP